MNNGRGIPIEVHKEHNVHIPSIIFGEMMTSSNYDDNEKKVTGGRNGFGAKLCNIFSDSFTGTDTKSILTKSYRILIKSGGFGMKLGRKLIDFDPKIKLKQLLVERNSNRHGLAI